VTRVIGLAALALSACVAARAADPAPQDLKPLWEFGLGVGALAFNDYRGSNTSHAYPIPLPYFVYRGRILRSDQDGLRGRLLKQDRIELNFSINGTTPVRNDSARRGMPDLRPTLEAGPALDLHLWRSADKHLKLDVRVPVREAFTIETSPRAIGLFAAPNVNLDIAQFPGSDGWKLGLLAGPLFAVRSYDEYFYNVPAQYSIPGRPAFAARGGYAGTQTLLSLTRRYPSYWIGGYIRYDTLAGASFADSPLVKTHGYWTAGFGVSWMIARSTRLVASDE
jgi:outer membrane scaffolding protein for murein synthesis (MipA/OmpV family)